MKYDATTPEEYIAQIPEDRKEIFSRLRQVILEHLPEGFQEGMNYGMIGYAVPHSIYPNGYHVDPRIPLPFMSIASQKNFIAFYHSGMYANEDILHWFQEAYPSYAKTKLDMGKSCIRFKKLNDIPFDLIAELVKKISVREWIDMYEKAIQKK